MRTAIALLVPSLVLVAAPARAHFHLVEPAPAVVESDQGNPQKPSSLTDACPSGTPSGVVTKVHAGDKLHVKVTETVGHGGHYRVAFAQDKSAFSFPDTVVTNDQCMSASIESPPTAPVLADGLFQHDQNQANAQNVCNGTPTCDTDVTVPSVDPGTYVLQVIEFMTPHGSAANNGAWGCYYAHCATIEVVPADADAGVITTDAGAPPPSTSSSSGSSAPSTSSGSAATPPASSSDDGCAMTSANGASAWLPLVGVAVALRTLRRRAPRRDR